MGAAVLVWTAAPAWAQGAVASLPPPPSVGGVEQGGRVRAQLSAKNTMTLSAELAARIAVLPLRDGDAFEAGDVLASFDCSLYEAQLRKAEASTEAAQALVHANQRLAALNSIGEFELAQSQARLKEGQADVAAISTTLTRCRITAPFPGRVLRRIASTHQYVTPGTPLLELVETGAMEVQLIAPSKWLAWLKPGQTFTVQVDELGRTSTARVARMGAQVDPVSQSITVVGVIDSPGANLRPGMSGWAQFSQRR
jgi:RND family efflux transporter MFP subunit